MGEYIYRMQNKNGEGCYMASFYRPSDEVEEFLAYHSFTNGRPCPQEDIGIMRNAIMGKEICGFESLRQAIKWFPHYERKFLRLDGFNIVKVEVKKITARGKRQCLAIPYQKVTKYLPIRFSNDILDFCQP